MAPILNVQVSGSLYVHCVATIQIKIHIPSTRESSLLTLFSHSLPPNLSPVLTDSPHLFVSFPLSGVIRYTLFGLWLLLFNVMLEGISNWVLFIAEEHSLVQKCYT